MRRAETSGRNAAIRRRRAQGVKLRAIMAEFDLPRATVEIICADIHPIAVRKPAGPIRLDAKTLAEIADAKRNPGPPYKNALGWAP